MCSGAASLPSQFVDMSGSPFQPFDWMKEQSKILKVKEVISLIRKHKLYSRKIQKGDSSVTKALLRMNGQFKLIKSVLYRKTILDNNAKRKPRLQLILPSHMTKRVLNGSHNQVGHQGVVGSLQSFKREILFLLLG